MIPQDKPFNMAELFLTRIDKRIDQADEASIQGEMLKFYRCLRTIFININFKLTDDEKVQFRQQFTEVVKNLFPKQSGNAKIDTQIMAITVSRAEEGLCDIYEKLTSIMFDRELIFPKTTQDYITEIEEDFG